MCVAFSFGFGIVSISKEFIPFFFGPGYDECVMLTKVFSIVLIIKAFSHIMQTQYMIPFKKAITNGIDCIIAVDKKYIFGNLANCINKLFGINVIKLYFVVLIVLF